MKQNKFQSLDYSNRNEDQRLGKVDNSLISTFKTRNGRIVRDGGGINPDINTKREDISDISISLMSKNLIFDFHNFQYSLNCIKNKTYS